MEMLIQAVVNGICVGFIFSLGAMGLVVIYKSSGVFNMAQGMMMMMGAFVAATFALSLGMPVWLSTLVGMAVMAVVGLVVERLMVGPLVGQPLFAQLMATIGLLSILRGICMMIWRTRVYIYPENIIPMGDLVLGSFKLSASYLNAAVIAIAAGILLGLYYRYSKQGIAMRAISEDEQLAESVGVKAKTILALTWALGGVVAALAGTLFGLTGSVNYVMGDIGLIAIMPAVLLGGLDSFTGALLAGPIIGVTAMITGMYLEAIAPGIVAIVPLAVMLIVLLFRPHGLFGQRRIERI